MKKLLIAALALITVLTMSLAACGDNTQNTDGVGDDAWMDDNTDATNTGDNTTNTDTPGAGTGNSSNTTTEEWVDKAGTVYVVAHKANLREDTSMSATTVDTVELGTALTRTQTNGTWDKIDYNGKTVYILSDLVTISAKRVTFVDRSAEELVLHLKAGMSSNLRTSPVYVDDNAYLEDDFNLKGTLTSAITAEDGLKLVALSEDGDWAQVSFKGTAQAGQTFNGTEKLYIRTTYIIELTSAASGDNAAG